MGNRRGQLDMAHAVAADGGFGDLDAAAVADDAFVTDFLIFAAVAFPVLARPEDPLTEEAVLLRL